MFSVLPCCTIPTPLTVRRYEAHVSNCAGFNSFGRGGGHMRLYRCIDDGGDHCATPCRVRSRDDILSFADGDRKAIVENSQVHDLAERALLGCRTATEYESCRRNRQDAIVLDDELSSNLLHMSPSVPNAIANALSNAKTKSR